MEKKQLFAEIANLPLQEKISKVLTYVSDKEEQTDTIRKLIIRDKEVTLIERLEMLKKYFPDLSDDALADCVEEARKKPRNLSNKIRLKQAISQSLESLQKKATLKERNLQTLKVVETFLTQKLENNEFVDKDDCQRISQMLKVEVYPEYAEEMKRATYLAARFRHQRIKNVGISFFNQTVTVYQIIELDIWLKLLEENYLSDEVYSLLIKHFSLLTKEIYPAKAILAKLKEILEADKKATLAEKERLEKLIEAFEKAIEYLQDLETAYAQGIQD